MARVTNKKVELKKKCKLFESDIKRTLAEEGIKYSAKSIKLDPQQTRDHIMYYIQDAIDDVKNNAIYNIEEPITDEFCKIHGLPPTNSLEDFSDVQALYVAMIVPELYPDIDHYLGSRPNLPSLLFPALARDKLNKARVLIKNEDLKNAELLIDEVEVISEMIVSNYSFIDPEPNRKVIKDRIEHKKAVSKTRSSTVKKSSPYHLSIQFRVYIEEYVNEVKSLLEEYKMPLNPTCVFRYCIKGFSQSDFKGNNDFKLELSNLALNLEDKYEKHKKIKSLEKSDEDRANITVGVDDMFINLGSLKRHLKVILSL